MTRGIHSPSISSSALNLFERWFMKYSMIKYPKATPKISAGMLPVNSPLYRVYASHAIKRLWIVIKSLLVLRMPIARGIVLTPLALSPFKSRPSNRIVFTSKLIKM